jgi:hypothetical protein
VRGIALDPITAASGPLGVIAFMNAAFGLRFLPLLFFAFFFAISISPLNDCRCVDCRRVLCRYSASGDEKMHDMPEKCQRFSEGKWLSRAALCESSHALRPALCARFC